MASGDVENFFEDGEDTFEAVDAVPANVKVCNVLAGLIVFEPIPMVASDWFVLHAWSLLRGRFGQSREKFKIWTILVHGHLSC